MEKALFAAGCFWGVEDRFAQIKGVLSTRVGYCGGSVENPTYHQVCDGNTGHAETVEITFDPSKVTYEQLLDAFWNMHDPTTKNRQGPDVGEQYRSAIFFLNDEQKNQAEKSLAFKQKQLAKPITTEIVQATPFYSAEEYHQKYLCKKRGVV